MTSPLSQTITSPRAMATVASLWLVYFVFGTTSGFGLDATWHDEQRFVQTLLLAVTALSLLVLSLRAEVRAAVPGLAWPLWALLGVAVVSGARARFPGMAAVEIGLFLGLFGLAMFFATFVRVAPALAARSVLVGVMMIAATQEFAVMARYASALAVGMPLDFDTLTTGFANRRFASAFYAVLIPLLAAACVSDSVEPRWRRWCFGLMTGLWSINFGLGTRAMLLAFGLAAPVLVALLGWQRIKRAVAAIAASFALGGLIYLASFEWLPALFGTSTASNVAHLSELDHTSGRVPLWIAAVKAWASSPWLGIGPMHYAALERVGAAHPHNWALQWLAELGVLGLGLIVAALAVLVLRGRRAVLAAPEEGRWLIEGAYAAVLIALIYGLVDGNFVMPVSQCALAMAFGLVVGGAPAPLHAEGQAWRAVAAAPLIALGAVTTVRIAAQGLPRQNTELNAFQTNSEQEWLSPRFWQQGLLWRHWPMRQSDGGNVKTKKATEVALFIVKNF